MAAKQALIITLAGNRPIQDVALDLESAGLSISHILEFTGTIAGSASPEAAERFRTVPGVFDVSPDSPVDVGPPDSELS